MKNIPVANPYIREEEAKAVYEVARSGWLSSGDTVREFESAFAEYVGAKYAVAVNNGTAALHLALIASGITDGDEVLVPDITFISSSNVVLYERATPILVECEPETYNISLKDAERRLTEKTKAIMPVDMNGMPVDYDAVAAFAKRHGLKVISDSAESLGALYKGRRVGSIAPVHVFSFFPNKNITTGEGGMLTTNDGELAKLARQLCNQGQDYRYNHIHLGFNYRMPNLPAALGLEQLKRIEFIVSEKQKIVERYNEAFKDDPIISPPFLPDYVDRHAWYMYAVNLKEGIDRDAVVEELKRRGIDTRLSFPPVHIQPYYMERFGFTEGSYPESFGAWSRLINLPIWVGLTSIDQDRVISELKDIVSTMEVGAAAPVTI